MSKQLVKLFQAEQTRKLAECECVGSGSTWTCEDPEHDTSYTAREKGYGSKCWLGHKLIKILCPTCAEVRGLDLRIHEFKRTGQTKKHADTVFEGWLCGWKCSCGKFLWTEGIMAPEHHNHDNPDLTTYQHGSKLWITHALHTPSVWDEFISRQYTDADILTDGELLVPAIGAWLEGRGK